MFSGLCCGYSAAVNWSSPDLCKCYISNIKQLSESVCAAVLLSSDAAINSFNYLLFVLPLFMSGKSVQSLFLIMCFLQRLVQCNLGSVQLCKSRERSECGGERAVHPPYLVIFFTSDRNWKNEAL